MSSPHQNIISENELNQKAWEYRYIDRDAAMQFAIDAKNNAEKENQFINLHFAELTIAQLNFWKFSQSEQIISVNKSLLFFETAKHPLGIARAHLICAGMYDQFGQYDKALHHAINAVNASDLIDKEINKADCYTNLGQVYSRIHDYKNAIQALEKGLEIRKNNNEQKAIASSLNLIARNYVLYKNYDKATHYYNESLTLRKNINDSDGLPWTYLGLASLYYEIQSWELAIEFYNKAEAANLKREQRFELLCLIGKAKIYIQEQKINEAVLNLNNALALAEALHIVSIKAEVHQLLAESFEKLGNYEQSLFHYKTFNTLQQELMSNEKVNQLKNQQIAFSIEASEKEAEIHRVKNIELKFAFDTIEKQHHQLEEKSKEITDSINYAKRIQDSYLPEKELLPTLFPNSFLLFLPKDIVSGDFYWFTNLDNENNNKLCTAADCTGHGVPGAIMSVICSNALNETVTNKKITRPDLILNDVREQVINAFKKQGVSTQKDGMDISLIKIIETDNKLILQFAGANNPLWIVREGQPAILNDVVYKSHSHYLIEIKADKQPIGNYEVTKPFTLHEIQLQKGDALYSFTDGYADQFGGMHGKKLKYKSLKELLLLHANKKMVEQRKILNDVFANWKGNIEQVDDVCMIGIKI